MEESVAIQEVTPHYKWRYRGGKMFMDYGIQGHRDRMQKVNGRFEWKRHVHASPAFSDMMGHPNFGKSYIRFDVLVFASIKAFADYDVLEFIEGPAKA